MEQYEVTGGGMAGWLNASWPFASLKVTEHRLEFKIIMAGSYSFTMNEIQSLDTFCYVPLLLQGIRIRHSVSEYPDRLIFFSFVDPDLVLRKIQETGFFSGPTSEPDQTDRRRAGNALLKWGGFPVRLSFVFVFLILWFGLFFSLALSRNENTNLQPVESVLVTTGFPLLVTILTLFSERFRKQFVLKEGRSLQDIKRFLYVLLLTLTVLLLGFLSMLILINGLPF